MILSNIAIYVKNIMTPNGVSNETYNKFDFNWPWSAVNTILTHGLHTAIAIYRIELVAPESAQK